MEDLDFLVGAVNWERISWGGHNFGLKKVNLGPSSPFTAFLFCTYSSLTAINTRLYLTKMPIWFLCSHFKSYKLSSLILMTLVKV